ncbi:tRNA lysidine(34) synthetase TilS [Alloscardovia omnicolens]|uniref:tRNA lysidine(34) synthetase TilS n=1 Tax=Alloscardovia omnicolens TaxID=419015 RepID=UPI003A5E74CE
MTCAQRAHRAVLSALPTVRNEDLILVACSGGRDSLALAAAAVQALTCHVGAVIINHQLQDGSDQVAEQAASQCAELGLDPVRIMNITVPSTGAGLEADARDARYEALARTAHDVGAAYVLVAHTSDDVAETILIKLLRTPSIEALTGMDAEREFKGVHFVRPFLTLSRADTTALCQEWGLHYWDDPTNGESVDGELDADFPLRSKIRHDVLPLLSRVSGRNSVELLASSAQRSREDFEIIRESVHNAYAHIMREKNGVPEIKIRALRTFSPAIQRRVVAQALENMGIKPSQSAVSDILQLADVEQKKKTIQISSPLIANKLYEVIQLWKDSNYANF